MYSSLSLFIPREAAKYDNINFNTIDPKEFLKINYENFVITRANINSVLFNPNKKGGMGGYPHNGRVIVKTRKESSNRKAKREFILIGIQDERPILNRLDKD